MQVRDRLLNQEVKMPQSSVNKEYYIQNQERAIANAEGTQPARRTQGTQPTACPPRPRPCPSAFLNPHPLSINSRR